MAACLFYNLMLSITDFGIICIAAQLLLKHNDDESIGYHHYC